MGDGVSTSLTGAEPGLISSLASGTGSLRSSFLSCLRSAHRLLWRSCAISGALRGDVFGSSVLDSVQVVQEAAPVLGKPVSS